VGLVQYLYENNYYRSFANSYDIGSNNFCFEVKRRRSPWYITTKRQH